MRMQRGTIHRILAGLLAVGAVLTVSSPAAADDVKDRQAKLADQLKDLREDLEGTSDDLVEAAVRLKTAESRLADADARLSSARTALARANRRDQELAGRLDLAQAAVGKAQRDLDVRAGQERDTRNRLAGIARETYVSSGLAGLSIALAAQSPEQFADRLGYAGNVLRAQSGIIDRLAVEQAETRARQAKLEAGRQQVAELKEQSEQVVKQRAAATAAAKAATDEIGDLVQQRQGAVDAIAAKKASEQKRVDRAEAEQAKLAEILRNRARARSGRETDGGSTLSHPVSAPITSGYGWRYHPILGYRRLHAGTDFGAPCGTPVKAAASGTIVQAGWSSGGYGNHIVVDHGRMRGADVATTYNHLSRIVVSSGQVGRGEVIGYSGTTGLSTGCHLHFEVWVNGSTTDPMGWL
jgi:murein DD-endopeptidase MepM/ murein hydrolase activator NlpD